MYVYVCVCVCVCVCTYVCMYVCIYVCMYVYPFSNAVVHGEFNKLNLQYPDFDRISLVDAGSCN